MESLWQLQVNKPLARPTGVCLDRSRGEVWVSNLLGQNVVRYKLGGGL